MAEFYKLNPARLMRYQPYIEEMNMQSSQDMHNVGWVNGRYIAQAISACFAKGKRYPDEPDDIISHFRSTEDDDDESVHPMTDADRFGAWAAMFNKQFEMKHNSDTQNEQTVE